MKIINVGINYYVSNTRYVRMNNFDVELQELIDKWRDALGVSIEELRDALQDAADKLAEEIDAKMI